MTEQALHDELAELRAEVATLRGEVSKLRAEIWCVRGNMPARELPIPRPLLQPYEPPKVRCRCE